MNPFYGPHFDGQINWIVFWISALACYRITILISRCLGPWELFKKLRSIPAFSTFLKCPFCVSIYVGLLISLGLSTAGFNEPMIVWFYLSLSFSAVSIALDRTFTADHNP